MDMYTETSAGTVLYTHNNRCEIQYLLIKHSNGGHWDFPKGKVEKDESLSATALRELHEETGVVGTLVPGFEYTYHYEFYKNEAVRVTKTAHFFIAHSTSTAITLSHEHLESKWCTYEQALQLVTYDNGRELLRKADAFIHMLQCT
jgi:bis(5'-nucleosidyl)-tetraphosphatase